MALRAASRSLLRALDPAGAVPWRALASAAAPAAAAGAAGAAADAGAALSAEEFGLTPDQVEFHRLASSFAAERLAPHSAEWDARHHFPVDVLREAAALGFGALYAAPGAGGSGLGRADGAVVFEALARGDVPVAAYLSIHNMVAAAVDAHGSPEQRAALVPRLASMDALASYCLTEPGAGSDAGALRTAAVQRGGAGGDWVLTGEKAFISGGGVSDVYLVMARTGAVEEGPKGISAFVVEKGAPGLSFGKRERKLGWNAQPTTAVVLDGVRLPASAMLGARGGGFRIAMAALDGGRVNIGACSVGGAAFALDYAAEYVRSRHQFGRPLAELQATQFRLADMATALAAARALVRRAGAALDARAPHATADAAMAKRFASDEGFNVANAALQLLGGYGYLQEYPVERVLRDLRVHSILEGTNEVMRLVIAREMARAAAARA